MNETLQRRAFENAAFGLYFLSSLSPDLFPGAPTIEIAPNFQVSDIAARDCHGHYTFPGVENLWFLWKQNAAAGATPSYFELACLGADRAPGKWEMGGVALVHDIIGFLAHRGDALTAQAVRRFADLKYLVQAVREPAAATPAYQAAAGPLLAYLAELPGYSVDLAPEAQPGTAIEMHSFVTMQFKRIAKREPAHAA